jgi:hypothetical protein
MNDEGNTHHASRIKKCPSSGGKGRGAAADTHMVVVGHTCAARLILPKTPTYVNTIRARKDRDRQTTDRGPRDHSGKDEG